MLISAAVPIAGTGVEEGRKKKKKKGEEGLVLESEQSRGYREHGEIKHRLQQVGGAGLVGGENERVLLLVFAGAASVEMRVPAARLEQADVAI